MISELADSFMPSPFYNLRGSTVIDTITPHVMAQPWTAETCGQVFQRPGKNASANYGIGIDGKIICYVDEDHRAWTSSDRPNDTRAITIECASDNTAPYKFNTKVLESLVALMTDICQRYPTIGRLKWANDPTAIGRPDITNITLHRWFNKKKSCPGDYMINMMPLIVNMVNDRLDGAVSSGQDTIYRVQVGAFKDLDNAKRFRDDMIAKGYDCFITGGK